MADGRHVSLVAELDGAVVGSLAASVLDVSDTSPARGWLPAQHLYIGLTSVTAGVRGRGFGADLVEAALAWATDQGLGCAMLHYVVENDLAGRLGTRQGFVPVITGWTRTTG
ncbi:MAG TPA: GNAT family N-acetyltransferase [Actinotalea sp.]|nr:GNAT family N-acetyltransferase [Actinotalea sp.]